MIQWKEIAERYEKIGLILIENTNEGTLATIRGMDQGLQNLEVLRRKDKVLLRMGFEFLIKSLYIKKRWNIYKFRRNPVIRISQINTINECDLRADKTIPFYDLICNLDRVIPNNSEISRIKIELQQIREDGNGAIHSDVCNAVDGTEISSLKSEIIKLF